VNVGSDKGGEGALFPRYGWVDKGGEGALIARTPLRRRNLNG